MHRKLARTEPVLLNFSVKNYLSIEDKQEISFVASSLRDNDLGLLENQSLPGAAILPALVLYGANASGKSNFLDAIRYVREAVLSSQTSWKPESGTHLDQFQLGAENEVPSPSIFEVNFIHDRVRYQYGFEASAEEFLSEWLYWYPNQHQQKLFTRTKMEFDWGRALKGQREIIRELTRANSLFLSAAAQNGHESLSRVRDAFAIMGGSPAASIEVITTETESKREMDSRALEYLAKVGTGISGSRHKEEELDEKSKALFHEMGVALKKIYQSEAPEFPPATASTKRAWMELGHKSKDGRIIYFSANRESAGTRRLLSMLGPIFFALDQGGLMIIDEMSNSLHTRACELIFSLFCNRATNPNGAQLLAATHDTNLLRSALLRRDQVWFVEKNEYGASHVYPLTDIRTKKSDDIEKGYIQGRFGAVPFAGQINESWNEA